MLRRLLPLSMILFGHVVVAECVNGERSIRIPSPRARALLEEFVSTRTLRRLTIGGTVDDGRCEVSVTKPAADGTFEVQIAERVWRMSVHRQKSLVVSDVAARVSCDHRGDDSTIELTDVFSFGDDPETSLYVGVRGGRAFVQVPNPDVVAYYAPKVMRCEAEL